MPEWLDITNSWAAIPLQFLGFGIAVWQIRKAISSADAAKLASTRAEARIGSNLLLVILPQLNQTETNLEWAVSRSDREAVIHYLGSWRWQAGQLRGHLGRTPEMTNEVMTLIQDSITTAADTKLALQDVNADVARRCKAAQKSIAAVTGLVGEITAKNQIEGTSSNGGDEQIS